MITPGVARHLDAGDAGKDAGQQQSAGQDHEGTEQLSREEETVLRSLLLPL